VEVVVGSMKLAEAAIERRDPLAYFRLPSFPDRLAGCVPEMHDRREFDDCCFVPGNPERMTKVSSR
jgi:hypothetical protein